MPRLSILAVACAVAILWIVTFWRIAMRLFLCLFLVSACVFGSAMSADAAGIGLGAARVRVRAPGVRVNVGGSGILRGGLFSRGLFRNRAAVQVNVGRQLLVGRNFNRSAVQINFGHAVAVRSFAVAAQAVYAQPVIVQQAPVVVQQRVYAAPALQSLYAAPVVQYAVPAFAAVNYAPAVFAAPSCGVGRSFSLGSCR